MNEDMLYLRHILALKLVRKMDHRSLPNNVPLGV